MRPILFVALVLCGSIGNSQGVALTVVRRVGEPQCTMGELQVGGDRVAYTLERPPIGNINYISSIPEGTYPAHVRADGDLGWRLELSDVPGRTRVQIHIGNTVDNTIGCILLGTSADVSACTVHDSGSAMRRLRTVLRDRLGWRGFDTPIRVTVTCDGDCR